MTSALLHGGDVLGAAAASRCDPAQIIDFSANINPSGLPPCARQALVSAAQDPEALRHYPDWTRHPLRYKLAGQLGVASECIVLGAGASALITDAVRTFSPSHCLAFGPAFAEYRRASLSARSNFTISPLDRSDSFRLHPNNVSAEIQRTGADLFFLNNPHNPSGILTQRNEMLGILDAAAGLGCAVVLDEAFIDYAPGHALTAEAAIRPNLIAIRSLTKFYGCPALRIGYAVAHSAVAERLQAQMPAWPVGSLAMNALHSAVGDQEFAEQSLQNADRERASLVAALKQLGLHVFNGAANFLLLELPSFWPDSRTLQEQLLHSHCILVRDCSSFDTLEPGRYIRVAVLGARHNRLLAEALASTKSQMPA